MKDSSQPQAETQNQTPYAGHSLSFDVGIAKIVGVEAAVLFNHILFWVKTNKRKPECFHEGRVWMYQTQAEMASATDDLMTERDVKYNIKKLYDSGLIVKGNFSKGFFQNVNWYSVADPNMVKHSHTSNINYEQENKDFHYGSDPVRKKYKNGARPNSKQNSICQEVGPGRSNGCTRPGPDFVPYNKEEDSKYKISKERREESRVDKGAPPTPPPKVKKITVDAQNNKFANLSQSEIDLWQASYPSINVKNELIHCFLKAMTLDPRDDWRGFILKWLGNVQKDLGKSKSYAPSQVTKEKAKELVMQYSATHRNFEMKFTDDAFEIWGTEGACPKSFGLKYTEKGFCDQLDSVMRKMRFAKVPQNAQNRPTINDLGTRGVLSPVGRKN